MRDNKVAVAVPEDKVRDSLLEVMREMYGGVWSAPPTSAVDDAINTKLHGIDGSQYLTMD
jgi:hypothetical protein